MTRKARLIVYEDSVSSSAKVFVYDCDGSHAGVWEPIAEVVNVHRPAQLVGNAPLGVAQLFLILVVGHGCSSFIHQQA